MSNLRNLTLFLVLSLAILGYGLKTLVWNTGDRSSSSEVKPYEAKVMAAALNGRVDQGLRVLQEVLMNPEEENQQLDYLCLIAFMTSFREYGPSDGPWIRNALDRVIAKPLPETNQTSDAVLANFMTFNNLNVTWRDHAELLLKILPHVEWDKRFEKVMFIIHDINMDNLGQLLELLRTAAQEQQVGGEWLGETGEADLIKTAQMLIMFNYSCGKLQEFNESLPSELK